MSMPEDLSGSRELSASSTSSSDIFTYIHSNVHMLWLVNSFIIHIIDILIKSIKNIIKIFL